MIEPLTAEEVKAAYDAITADGPMAPATQMIGAACLKMPLLKAWLRMTVLSFTAVRPCNPGDEAMIWSLAQAAMMIGLNYGLRIGQARGERAEKAS